MGVNCKWQGHAPMSVVADVVGLFMGCARSFDPTYGWVNVAGVRTEPTSVPKLREIVITLGAQERRFWWHHESGPGLRSLSALATVCNVALVRALGQALGGTAVLNDADSTTETYPAPTGVDLWAKDGADWYRLQALLASIRPLTAEDFEAVREYAY